MDDLREKVIRVIREMEQEASLSDKLRASFESEKALDYARWHHGIASGKRSACYALRAALGLGPTDPLP